jgi:hypothetical protein
MKNFLRFWVWRFCRSISFREVKHFIMLDYDVSLHELVELVVIFKTSPSSSKLESGCSSYDCFHFGVSASFRGAEIPAICRAEILAQAGELYLRPISGGIY